MIFNGVIQVAGGGSGTKAAHGESMGSGGNVFVVNGIGFKPSFVSVLLEANWIVTVNNITVSACSEELSYNYLDDGITFMYSTDLSVSFLEDGFSVTTPDSIFYNERRYYWAAFE